MKVLFTGDWQIEGKNQREFERCAKHLIDYVHQGAVRTVAILGDIFEKPNVCDTHASTGAQEKAIIEVVVALAQDCYVLLITGNHDKDSDVSGDALHCLDIRSNIQVIREPGVHALESTRFACLPWLWDPGRTVSAALSHMTGDILLGHCEVMGAKRDGTNVCPHEPGQWRIDRDTLARMAPTSFGYIALGHFHARQRLFGQYGGFIGALRQRNYGEEGNPQGFEIYDTDSRQSEWIENLDAPRFQTLIIESQGELDIISRLRPQDHQRIKLAHGAATEEQIKSLRKQGVRVDETIQKAERVARAIPERIAADLSPRELFSEWAGSRNPPICTETTERCISHIESIGKGDKS